MALGFRAIKQPVSIPGLHRILAGQKKSIYPQINLLREEVGLSHLRSGKNTLTYRNHVVGYNIKDLIQRPKFSPKCLFA